MLTGRLKVKREKTRGSRRTIGMAFLALPVQEAEVLGANRNEDGSEEHQLGGNKWGRRGKS